MSAISKDTLSIFHNKMLACHLQSPNMHFMFQLFLTKEEKDFMEFTETLHWLHVFMIQQILFFHH